MSEQLLTRAEMDATAAWIASVQLPNGMIPWFPGGHADPWNHTEAAMALTVGGQRRAAEAAYEWLEGTQLPDGSWCLYYLAEGVEEPRRDPNVCAYPAAGLWWHYLETGDEDFLARMWPMVDAAIDFVVRLQAPGGEILWSKDVDGKVGTFALLTCNASIHHSLRCAVAIAEHLGHERPDWELAASRVGHAVAHRPDAFLPKERWAMDWYYPVLGGALGIGEGRPTEHLDARWDAFVLDGVGVRCVASDHWITTAETAECVMALDVAGRRALATELLGWTRHFRCQDGSYYTGCVHPQCVKYPGRERSSYGAAAVVMAHHVLGGFGPASGLFRGEHLPEAVELSDLSDLPAT